MGKYLFKRAIRGVVTLVGIMIVVFLITHAIGDPALLMMPDDFTNELLWYTRESLGLNKPLIAQFGDFVLNTINFVFAILKYYFKRIILNITLRNISAPKNYNYQTDNHY